MTCLFVLSNLLFVCIGDWWHPESAGDDFGGGATCGCQGPERPGHEEAEPQGRDQEEEGAHQEHGGGEQSQIIIASVK